MSKFTCNLEFACSPCNCNPSCFSWIQLPNSPESLHSSYLVFGTGCFLALAEVFSDRDSAPPRILSYASSHTGLVTTVRRVPRPFIPASSPSLPLSSLFVSTSADKTACVWQLTDDRVDSQVALPRVELLAHLIGHTDSVTGADSILYANGTSTFLIVCTISIDSTLRCVFIIRIRNLTINESFPFPFEFRGI